MPLFQRNIIRFIMLQYIFVPQAGTDVSFAVEPYTVFRVMRPTVVRDTTEMAVSKINSRILKREFIMTGS